MSWKLYEGVMQLKGEPLPLEAFNTMINIVLDLLLFLIIMLLLLMLVNYLIFLL